MQELQGPDICSGHKDKVDQIKGFNRDAGSSRGAHLHYNSDKETEEHRTRPSH